MKSITRFTFKSTDGQELLDTAFSGCPRKAINRQIEHTNNCLTQQHGGPQSLSYRAKNNHQTDGFDPLRELKVEDCSLIRILLQSPHGPVRKLKVSAILHFAVTQDRRAFL